MAKFALVDCNNFYASCERVFRPDLRDTPIVVLSNNDGCIIARSAEAKAAGIPMGAPYFKCRAQLERCGVEAFSSNYALYGDMSARVMRVLDRFVPRLEIYSIDEAFADLSGVPGGALQYARRLRATVCQWTGIPVSIGIGPTKTLAKVANRFAKKQARCRGVFDFGASPDPDLVLDWTDVGDVWGIGRKHAKRLRAMGVNTAREFRDLDRDWVRRKMSVTGLHTLLELRGMPCFGLDNCPAPKKNIVSSRSFGRPVKTLDDMREAVACYVTRAAEKLRRQRSTASGIMVFLHTNKFIANLPQYSNSEYAPVHPATMHTPTLIRAAHQLLERIWRDGYSYKKGGVMLSGLEPAHGRWLSLLELPPDDRPQDGPLMRALDGINARWGRDTVLFAASGLKRDWRMRRERRSPRYTTAWAELPVVRA
ncbi:Y-family DNA polymerase [Salidesulfovibrio onnuriiensis]|uniref:Y-family DNA polymerase n=1 Tax=Salidesulfovibrio onnuriiensis TaxID=2583823 RepID=UPI0011C86B5F|nr:Y-family DNA polymerase [Salidesulfovibrio onnuriiensis]